MKIVWICDPWKRINNPKETTIRLIQESINLGHECSYCDINSIKVENSKLSFTVSRIFTNNNSTIAIDTAITSTLLVFDVFFFRVDPPFDEAYFSNLKLINGYIKSNKLKIEAINNIDQLLSINSKVSCLFFKDTPRTIYTSDFKELTKFGLNEKITVAKQISSGASVGVRLLKWANRNDVEKSNKIIDEMTLSFVKPIILQEFLYPFYEKEIRVWFICGEQLASVGKRMPKEKFPFDTENGGFLEKCHLTSNQLSCLKEIGEFLKSKEVKLAAVDLIEDKVIDINIGSPGLLVEMENVVSLNIANQIIEQLFKEKTP